MIPLFNTLRVAKCNLGSSITIFFFLLHCLEIMSPFPMCGNLDLLISKFETNTIPRYCFYIHTQRDDSQKVLCPQGTLVFT